MMCGHPKEVTFLIEPRLVSEALLKGDCLRVLVHGDRLQYRKVTLERRAGPKSQADAKALRVA